MMTKKSKMGVIRNQLMCGVGFSSKLNVTEINEFLLFGIAQAIMKICLQCALLFFICLSIPFVQFAVPAILPPSNSCFLSSPIPPSS